MTTLYHHDGGVFCKSLAFTSCSCLCSSSVVFLQFLRFGTNIKLKTEQQQKLRTITIAAATTTTTKDSNIVNVGQLLPTHGAVENVGNFYANTSDLWVVGQK